MQYLWLLPFRVDHERVWFQTPRLDFEVEGAIAADFIELSSQLGTDRQTAFFQNRPIETADAQTFAVISGDYAKDRLRVYWQRIALVDADLATFVVVGEGYGRDKKQCWDCASVVP
jgi:hypothetical protein